jgi:hypothetical protein
MNSIALIFSTLALCVSILCLLFCLDILRISKPKPDKYEKYRNEDGLLGNKKEMGKVKHG